MKKKLTPKSGGHKTVPLDHFHSYKIILESVDTILYPHTNLYPTLWDMVMKNIIGMDWNLWYRQDLGIINVNLLTVT